MKEATNCKNSSAHNNFMNLQNFANFYHDILKNEKKKLYNFVLCAIYLHLSFYLKIIQKFYLIFF